MNTKIRLFRRPVAAIAWLLILGTMASLLGVGGGLLYSTAAMEKSLDSQHTTVALRNSNATGAMMAEYMEPLYAKDIEKLQAMESVEMVDLRTLTGAYIPELTAQLGLRNYGNISGYLYHQQDMDNNNHTTNMSYNEVILTGTIEEIRSGITDSHLHYDLSAIGEARDMQITEIYAVMNIEEVVSAHPTYYFFETEEYTSYCGKVYLNTYIYGEGETPFFEVGKRYIVSGSYDPSAHGRSNAVLSTPNDLPLPWVFLQQRHMDENSGYGIPDNGRLVMYRDEDIAEDKNSIIGTDAESYHNVLLSAENPVCLAQELEGNLEDFLESNPEWTQWIQEMEQTRHSFPVLGTECVETMHCFMTNAATVTQGRTFTQEEYDTGAKVLMLSEELALTGDIQVGDTLTLNQFLCDTSDWGNFSLTWSGEALEILNEPDIGKRPLANGFATEGETYTVVGIYRLERSWEDTAFSITPNTIFMPQKAQVEGGFGGPAIDDTKPGITYNTYTDENGVEISTDPVKTDIPIIRHRGSYGVFLSVKVKNGQMEEFQEELKGTGITADFITLDQGFDQAVEGVRQAKAQAQKLFALVALGWAALLLLYLLLFQGRQRRNLGIMRSLGAKPSQGRRYLFAGGFLLAAAGIGLGTALSGTVSKLLYSRLSQFLLSSEDMLTISGGQAITEDAVDTMLTLTTLPLRELLLLTLAQLLIVALVVWLQSTILAARSPRRLLGKT